mmetsp:Transcript_83720/g.260114  ORF Transcript_83720/g.260114 Transcript_83720/m.260114 type:complete len:201 (-) Transcript_83720:156-758(-)
MALLRSTSRSLNLDSLCQANMRRIFSAPWRDTSFCLITLSRIAALRFRSFHKPLLHPVPQPLPLVHDPLTLVGLALLLEPLARGLHVEDLLRVLDIDEPGVLLHPQPPLLMISPHVLGKLAARLAPLPHGFPPPCHIQSRRLLAGILPGQRNPGHLALPPGDLVPLADPLVSVPDPLVQLDGAPGGVGLREGPRHAAQRS